MLAGDGEWGRCAGLGFEISCNGLGLLLALFKMGLRDLWRRFLFCARWGRLKGSGGAMKLWEKTIDQ